jgi:multicomponent Na+:H+ antiporter subunit C
VVGEGAPDDLADPLVQAFALTAIVITFGVTVLLLALVHRLWVTSGSDSVPDDPEDRRLAAARDEPETDR